MEYIIFIVLFLCAIPLVVFMILKPIIADQKARNNIRNSDLSMQHYCFALDCNQTEALDKLSIRNVYDCLECALDRDHLSIVFSHLGESIEYQLAFRTVENKTYLRVSRVTFMHGRSNIPWMINRFFVEKIGAVPVDYNYFESFVCTPLK